MMLLRETTMNIFSILMFFTHSQYTKQVFFFIYKNKIISHWRGKEERLFALYSWNSFKMIRNIHKLPLGQFQWLCTLSSSFFSFKNAWTTRWFCLRTSYLLVILQQPYNPSSLVWFSLVFLYSFFIGRYTSDNRGKRARYRWWLVRP